MCQLVGAQVLSKLSFIMYIEMATVQGIVRVGLVFDSIVKPTSQ